MMISAYDIDGRIVGRLTLPDDPAIAQENSPPGGGYIEGHFDPAAYYISDGAPVAIPSSPGDWAVWDWGTHSWTDPRDEAWFAAQLADAKTSALAQITRLRGQARLAYITDIPGQEAIYIAKLEEARAYLSATDPDIADYPLIGSEVGVTAPTAYEVAQVFANLNTLWVQVAAAIDGACFAAEASVQAATTAEDVEAVVAALATQIGGLS